MPNSIDRAIRGLEKKLPQSINERGNGNEKLLDDEERRLMRMQEIEDLATKAYSYRCDAKLAEVGGADNLLKLVDNGEWNSYEEMTDIEREYNRLRNEQFELDWFRLHGKPYRMEDDPNAQFGDSHTKEEWEALGRKMTTNPHADRSPMQSS